VKLGCKGYAQHQQRRNDEDDNRSITLYRGVHGKHPDLHNAVNGMAVPRGLDFGHNNPIEHNRGDNNSIFTSWTTTKSMARYFHQR